MTSALTGTTIMQNHFSFWFSKQRLYLKYTEEFKTYFLGVEVGAIVTAPPPPPRATPWQSQL